MGFFKKRGKPRKYKIEVGYSRFYELYVWNRCLRYWDYLHLYHLNPRYHPVPSSK